VIAAALVVLTLIAGVVGTSLGLFEARAQRDAAREAEGKARDAESRADERRREVEKAREAEREANRRGHEAINRLAVEVWHGNLAPPFRVNRVGGVAVIRSDLPSRLPDRERQILNSLLQYYETFTGHLGGSREDLEAQAQSFGQMAAIRHTFGEHSAAASARQSALSLLECMVGNDPTEPKDRMSLRDAHVFLAEDLHRAGRHGDALTHWTKAATLSPADDIDFLFHKAGGLARAGLVDEAIAANDAIVRRDWWGDPYNSACVIALASAACKQDPALRDALALRAMGDLQGVARHYADYEDAKWSLLVQLSLDEDLDSLRGRPDFRALLAEVEEKYRRALNLPEVAPPPRPVNR
jgi:tetratricopeptide (TPR) repeat protein